MGCHNVPFFTILATIEWEKVVEYSTIYYTDGKYSIKEPVADVFFNRGVAPPTGFFGIAEM